MTLDNEPTGPDVATPTADATTTAPPAAPRRRRAASRPAGPPVAEPTPAASAAEPAAEPIAESTPAASAAAEPTAPAQSTSPAPTAAEPARAEAAAPATAEVPGAPAADGDAPVARAPRKRAPRKKAAVEAPAAVDVPAAEEAQVGPQLQERAVPDAAVPVAGATTDEAAEPAPPARRKRTRKAATQTPAEPEPEPEPSPSDTGTVLDAAPAPAPAAPAPQDPVEPEQTAPETEAAPSTAASRRAARAAAVAMPVFQAPDPEAAPRRRRSASRPAGPPQVVEPTADDAPPAEASSEPAAPVPAVGSDQGAVHAPDAPVEADDELLDDLDPEALLEPDAEEETEDDASRRRRRRRGGRGRRGRSGRGATDDETEDDDADAQEAPAAVEGAEGAEPVDEAEDDEPEGQEDEEGGAAGSRRRRRRRRRGTASGEAEPTPDDPPNTVVRVREGRRSGSGGSGSGGGSGDVTGLRGSTRLEAKKQRRREGREAGRRRPVITEAEFLARRESVERVMVVREMEGRTQIGVLEDGVLVEHYVARRTQTSTVGNVYLGKVQNVLPSMEAAFVDVGKGRNAVLYAGEVNWDAAGMEGHPKRIEHALKSGEAVLVQVTKDPIGHKGARLTSQISLPGRYLVYVPNGSMTGISRKLPENERARLKKILRAVVPDEAGVIVRTAAEGATEEELQQDVARLQAQWEDISRKAGAVNAPALLYGEPDLAIRVVRDIFNEDFAKLVVSGDEVWDVLQSYIGHVAPDLVQRIERWEGGKDVFAAHRIDEQLAKALDRKVWLPSGGSLVIDRTEAMTVVDVNTGKFTGAGGNLEQTVTENNIEAAEEIVRQLRLRDIGGIIVVDFIDMVLESNRELVLRRLLECLGRDRTKHQVAEVTSLGLVQMTRKRVGQGLLEVFSENCEHCGGRGIVLHDEPVEKRSQGSQDSGGSGGGGSHGGGSGGGSNGGGGGGGGGNGGSNGGGGRSGRSRRGGGQSSSEASQPALVGSSAVD